MRLLAFTALLMGFLAILPGAARAENPATLEFGCAPWDGRALRIKVGAPDAVYHVTLWANGIKALQSVAHAVTVDNKQESGGMGTGSVCTIDGDGKTKCTQELLKVEADESDFKVGDTVVGAITYKDTVVSFIGTVASHRGVCG
jgi:hypothetical protein